MLSVIKEQKNIPVSISILHEVEYNNLYMILKAIKRRAYSEKSNRGMTTKLYSDIQRNSLKNE